MQRHPAVWTSARKRLDRERAARQLGPGQVRPARRSAWPPLVGPACLAGHAAEACDPWLVFERFTERARQVVVLAQEEARALRHNYIGTEHLLLGLLREEEGLAARVLGDLGVTVDRVRGQVVRIVGSGEEVTSGQIPFTPRAKKVLELALREALSLGHNYIGTEHLLLALVRENEGVAARILLDFDADSEKIRNEVLRLLTGPSGRRFTGGVADAHRTPNPLRPPLDWDHAGLFWRPDRMLRGSLREVERLASRALAEFGLRVERVRSRPTPPPRPRAALRPGSVRLNPQARKAMESAKREAVSLGHDRIGPEHILLGVLSTEHGLAVHASEQVGLTHERVRPQVVAIVGSSQPPVSAETVLTPQARAIVERATSEARTTSCAYVGAEHLLLSLLHDKEVTAQILRNLDVDPESVRAEVLRWLNPGAPRRIPPPTPGLDWRRANLLWRPEGLELRIPLHLDYPSMATFAADEVWSQSPLVGLRREIWAGWLALAAPTLLQDIASPAALRESLDAAVNRALDTAERDGPQAADFLNRLRADP